MSILHETQSNKGQGVIDFTEIHVIIFKNPMDFGDNDTNITCACNRISSEISWTWQDGRVYSLALTFLGIIGTVILSKYKHI